MKKRWIALFVIVVLLTAGGCGKRAKETELPAEAVSESKEGVNAAASGPASGIQVIHDEKLGEEWTKAYDKGVRTVLENAPDSPDYSSKAVSENLVAAGIDQAVNDGCLGILITFDCKAEDIQSAISRATDAGVPVVCLDGRKDAGDSPEGPDNLGKAMTENLISRIALTQGGEKWGDSADFDKQLHRAVLGLWDTASSAGDRKQFVGDSVLEFTSVDPSKGYYALKRVSKLTDIKSTPDGDGYDYVLNTGNHYYLYPESFDTLGCHWEPDGYSGSDSLAKVEEFAGSGDDYVDISYFVDMSTYDGYEEVFLGRISRFTGYYGAGEEECLALNLDEPIEVITSDGYDYIVYALQLNTDFQLEDYADEDITVGVKGTLFEAHTAHHYTPVLLDVIQVRY